MPPLRLLPALFLLAALVPVASCGNGTAGDEVDLPERWFTYPMSHIYVKREGKGPGEQMGKVLEIMRALQSGTPFAEVAKLHSDNEMSAAKDGFLGFFKLDGSNPELAAAVQAVRDGMYSGPVDLEDGTHILYRHSFEEGREVESRHGIPAYGFLIPWDPTSGPGSEGLGKEEAGRRAKEASARIRSGQLTVPAAAQIYTPSPPPSQDAFVGMVMNQGKMKPLYEKLLTVEPGELVPPFALDGLHWVLKRGTYYRSMVRHILIQHIAVESRGLEIRRTRPEAEALALEVLAKARADGADWNSLVRRFTDDPHTAHISGSIGSGTNGDFHYEMQEVIEATPPGEIADHLAESRDGFHIIWRVN